MAAARRMNSISSEPTHTTCADDMTIVAGKVLYERVNQGTR